MVLLARLRRRLADRGYGELLAGGHEVHCLVGNFGELSRTGFRWGAKFPNGFDRAWCGFFWSFWHICRIAMLLCRNQVGRIVMVRRRSEVGRD